MIKPEDIKNVTFEQSVFSGYKKEEVDAFLDKMQQEVAQLYKQNAELAEKLKVCVAKIEEYRQDEKFLKSAIINAQKLNETTLHEVEEKRKKIEEDAEKHAAAIVCEAKQEAETIQKEAEQKVAQFREKTTAEFTEKRKNEEYAFLKEKEEYASRIAEEKAALEAMKTEVSDFRNMILGLYKQQVTLVCALPEKPKNTVVEEATEPIEPKQPEPQPEPEEVTEENVTEEKEETAPAPEVTEEETLVFEEEKAPEETAEEIPESEPETEEITETKPVDLPEVDEEIVLTLDDKTQEEDLADITDEFYAEEPKIARSPVEPESSPLHLPDDVERDIEEPIYYEDDNNGKKKYRNLKFGIDFDVNSEK